MESDFTLFRFIESWRTVCLWSVAGSGTCLRGARVVVLKDKHPVGSVTSSFCPVVFKSSIFCQVRPITEKTIWGIGVGILKSPILLLNCVFPPSVYQLWLYMFQGLLLGGWVFTIITTSLWLDCFYHSTTSLFLSTNVFCVKVVLS